MRCGRILHGGNLLGDISEDPITDVLLQWVSDVMEGWFDKEALADQWESDQEEEQEETFEWLEKYLEAEGFQMLPTMTKDNGLISSISLFFK